MDKALRVCEHTNRLMEYRINHIGQLSDPQIR